ncbi:MAG: hypothetical protein ACEPOZ_02510 [Marinifilaceae bacterium]
MKKNFMIVGALLCMSLFVSSCSDDDKEDKSNEFSEASVEENKKIVEDAGLKVISQTEAIVNEKAVAVSKNFVDLAENLSIGNMTGSTVNFSWIEPLAKLDQSKDVLELATSLKQEEGEGIEDLFQHKGVYTYNNETGDWKYVAGENGVVFKFPSTSENDDTMATLEISDFQVKNIMDETIPVVLKLKLEEGDQQIMSLDYSASVSADLLNQEISAQLVLGNYKFVLSESVKEGKVFASDVDFNAGDSQVLNFELKAEGDLKKVEDAEAPIEVLDKADFAFTLGDIMVDGEGDVKTLRDEEKLLYAQYDNENSTTADELKYMEGLVELMNKNVTMALRFSNNSQMIAKGEFFVKKDENDCEIDVRLKFGDDSYVDAETYFGPMLKTFYNKLLGLEEKLR